ncbi:MAG: protein kinase, partial [Pirellulaceae bacterium]
MRTACADLQLRLSSGERDALEKILAARPELAADEETAMELVYAEVLAREDEGCPPSVDELAGRFPQWRQRITRLLQVHAVFSPAEPEPGGTGTAAPSASFVAATAPPEAGSAAPFGRIGQYTVLNRLGSGGMGVVYKARQDGLNRLVALKVIRTFDASDQERHRFRLEAEATARLQHPNIVPIYEIGEHDDCAYLSMEFVQGGTLEELVTDGPLPARDAAELIRVLAEAMHFAHEQGVVHRDLKPANVLLTTGHVPKIADFGLAKRLCPDSSQHTHSGAILGTPCFMAPEQAEGRNADVGPPADVYSLGAILYQLLTGEPPFRARTAAETMDLVRTREPLAPSCLNRRTPIDLETICLTCLRKEPHRRYASARALADDLHRFLDHEPIRARPMSRGERLWRGLRRRPLVTGLATLAGCALAAFLAVLVWHEQRVRQMSTVAEASRREVEASQRSARQASLQAEASFAKAKGLVDEWTRFGQRMMDQPGMGEVSEHALQEALRHYEGLLTERRDDKQLSLEAARACERAGVIQLELGRWEAAEKSLRRGVEIYSGWPAAGPAELLRLSELANCLLQLGHAQRRQGRNVESEQSYRQSLALLHTLVERQPQHSDHYLRMANVNLNLCVV